ncbi:MAG: hypothetical protein OXG53_00945 [Chloroflexi bacterium]|nr:hypothetical protein [Chloroflexota bacterium]
MSESFLVLLISSILFVLWGTSSLKYDKVYWGRLFKYWGRKLVTSGPTPARVHGLPVTAGGVLGIVIAVLALFVPNSAVVETLLWVYAALILAGIIGSIVASSLGYGDEEQDPVALEQAMRRQHGDRFGRW